MNYILSKEQFQNLQQVIAAKTNDKTLTSADIVLYNIIRGKLAHHGFTPVTNTHKLEQLKKCYLTAWYAYNNCAAEGLQHKLKYYSKEYLTSMGIHTDGDADLAGITGCIFEKIVKYNG